MIIIKSKVCVVAPFVAFDGNTDLNEAYHQLTWTPQSAKQFIAEFEGVIVKARNPCDARLKYETESGLR